jgi:ferric-dicitrate binding protein FerR (iron transport regulator)
MMLKQKLHLICSTALILLVSHAFGADALPDLVLDARPEPHLHSVVGTDTLESLAERYLGTKDFSEELAIYNDLTLPADLSAISTLVIPGVERNHALTALWKVQDAQKLATDASGQEFSELDYAKAEQTYTAALGAFRSTDYLRARVLGIRARAEFVLCVEVANANALQGREATVIAVHGSLLTSVDGWINKKEAQAGDRIPVEAQLRTGPESRAEIQLPDGSVFFLAEQTDLGFTMKEDKRSGAMDTRLQINLGEIFGKIKPKKTKDSRFLIKNGRSAIVIRGTDVRTSRSEDGWFRAMTLKGEAEVTDERAASQQLVKGFGVYAKPDKSPGKPVELLPPPEMLYPNGDVVTTAEQVIPFSWKGARTWRSKGFRVELARDPKFVDAVFATNTSEHNLSSPILPDGDYYWRISSMDKHGLQGPETTPVKFVVKTDLGVVLTTDKAVLEKEGHLWIAPMTTVMAGANAENTSVVECEYSVNGSKFTPYAGGVMLQTHGTYTVVARGIGLDQRRGEDARRLYEVDGMGPEISVLPGDLETHPVKGEIQPLTISATDDSTVTSIEYSFDGKNWRQVSGPIYRDAGIEADLRTRATDAFGNVSSRRMILEPQVQAPVKPSFTPR